MSSEQVHLSPKAKTKTPILGSRRNSFGSSRNLGDRRPSLRRLTSIENLTRESSSSVANLTHYLPTSVATRVNDLPFIPTRGTSRSNVLQETYFCHICFMNNPKIEGFILSNCGHIFCRECIKGYFISRINDGQVFLKCFHPPTVKDKIKETKENHVTITMPNNINNNIQNNDSNENDVLVGGDGGGINTAGNNNQQNIIAVGNGVAPVSDAEDEKKTVNNDNGDGDGDGDDNGNYDTCHKEISELDIKAVVDEEIWDKYEKFKTNLENPDARQCPFCDTTQFGNKDKPIMKCQNNECGKEYCYFHSNAHDPSEPCESYDARMLKENKLNEARINEKAKRCPGCDFPIEKISGCNHMKVKFSVLLLFSFVFFLFFFVVDVLVVCMRLLVFFLPPLFLVALVIIRLN